MASIYRELQVAVPAARLWDRVKDVGNIAALFPGLFHASQLREDNTWLCTLADGSQLTGRILAVDDQHRPVACTITVSHPRRPPRLEAGVPPGAVQVRVDHRPRARQRRG